MHCGVRDLDRRGSLPLAAGQCRGRNRPPAHFYSGPHGLPPDQPARGISGPLFVCATDRKDAAMLGFAAAVLFIIAFLINATSTATSAVFSPMSLLLAGLACLALHLAGVGTKWSVPGRRTRR
jgi:hypothetical protein